MSTLLATQWGGAAGFALAAAIFQILKTAYTHHRLQSETYKRLHWGLFVFGTVGMLAIPGEAGFGNSIPYVTSAWLTLVRAYCAMVAWLGLKEGIRDNNNNNNNGVVYEMIQLTKQSWQGFRVKNAKKGLAYRNLMLLVTLGMFSNFMEGIFKIRYHGEFSRTWFEISLHWSAISRLFHIWTMIYTLKDAAERDRLTGTTFIQMNVLVGLWAVFIGLGQSVYPLGIAFYRGVEMYAFSLPFFVKAYKSQKEKSQKKLSV
jgi:zinc transporter ZupT